MGGGGGTGGIKEREDGERRGGGGRLFERGDYFKYFHQRAAINRGRLLIDGRLLFEEIRYFVSSLTEISIFRLLTFVQLQLRSAPESVRPL